MKDRELLTSSRMDTMLACQRKHFWRYEVGLRPKADKTALRIGKLWHTLMRMRWLGYSYDQSMADLTTMLESSEVKMDEFELGMLMALVEGYYKTFAGDSFNLKFSQTERPFEYLLDGSLTFKAAGVIDLLGYTDSESVLVEHKTTSESIAPQSDYWLRLRFNNQVMQYLCAVRKNGGRVDRVLYDVTRKPALEPKQIPMLDCDGFKIVKDASGNRVMTKAGKPRESGDASLGWKLETRTETADEFYQRLRGDVQTRPEFYFARKEVPVLDQDMDEFETQRLVIGRQILACRQSEKKTQFPDQAWPRVNLMMVCSWCEYSKFCLQNIRPDPTNPALMPEGFELVDDVHPEVTNAN